MIPIVGRDLAKLSAAKQKNTLVLSAYCFFMFVYWIGIGQTPVISITFKNCNLRLYYFVAKSSIAVSFCSNEVVLILNSSISNTHLFHSIEHSLAKKMASFNRKNNSLAYRSMLELAIQSHDKQMVLKLASQTNSHSR